MATQHTLAPWFSDGTVDNCEVYADSRAICVLKGSPDCNTTEELANINLIAAAPFLLEALEELLECQKFGVNALAKQIERKGKAKELARAAVAKAKGE